MSDRKRWLASETRWLPADVAVTGSRLRVEFRSHRSSPFMSDEEIQPLSPDDQFAIRLSQAQSRLFGFLFSRLANREQAMEVLQETNVVLLRKKQEFVSGTDFMAWCCSVAYFQMMAYRKRLGRERLVFDNQVIDMLSAHDKSESSSIDARQAALQQCMEKLNQRQKFLLDLRYTQGRSIDDIAQSLGKTANSIRLMLHRIRGALLECTERRLKVGS